MTEEKKNVFLNTKLGSEEYHQKMTISFGPTVTDQLEKKISDTNTN